MVIEVLNGTRNIPNQALYGCFGNIRPCALHRRALWRVRHRHEREDLAACKQANTQESAHRFSFSSGINFLQYQRSRRVSEENNKPFAVARLLYSAIQLMWAVAASLFTSMISGTAGSTSLGVQSRRS